MLRCWVGLVLALGGADEVVVDLAGAEDQAGDLVVGDPRLGQHLVELRLGQVLDPVLLEPPQQRIVVNRIENLGDLFCPRRVAMPDPLQARRPTCLT